MKKNLVLTALSALMALFFYSNVIAQGEINNKYSNILVLSKAVEALGKLGDAQARDVLGRGLKSEEYFIRAYSAEALSRLNDNTAIPLLKELAGDKNYLVRITVMKALVKLSKLSPAQRAAGEAEFNPEELLLGFLNDKDPSVRAAAVMQLGDFQDKYLPLLYAVLLKDESYLVREKIIGVLGGNKFYPAAGYIIQALEEANYQVRLAACYAVFHLRGKAAITLLRKRLNDESVFVAAAARELLGLLQDNSLLKLFREDTESRKPEIRGSSYVALANLKDLDILPVVLKAVVSTESPLSVKISAARSLATLKPYIIEQASKSLAGSKAKNLLTENIGVDYKINGRRLVSILLEALQDEENPLHAESALILGKLNEEASLPVLRQALFQKDPETVARVAYVLGELRDKRAVSYLIEVCSKYGL